MIPVKPARYLSDRYHRVWQVLMGDRVGLLDGTAVIALDTLRRVAGPLQDATAASEPAPE